MSKDKKETYSANTHKSGRQGTHTFMKSAQYLTREVNIGGTGTGGEKPVRLQSMTNTKTMDLETTVAQIVKIVDAGGELVRLTTPTVKDAGQLKNIRKRLKESGISVPLIADVHFSSKVAEVAAQYADKVRINPGNYAGNTRYDRELSAEEYAGVISGIRERLQPLVEICKRHRTAIRIGSNHGSLSPRIIHRYGNTAEGMVEAAMEFLRIFTALDFHDIVVSMKASNVKIMVEANRKLVAKMIEENMNYPIHLGVTEAGDGEDGRIKSAAGIGILLADNIGDTIRVSLTEEPEREIPVARSIRDIAQQLKTPFPIEYAYSKKYRRREHKGLKDNTVAVIVSGENFAGKADFIARENRFVSREDNTVLSYHTNPQENPQTEKPWVVDLDNGLSLGSIYQQILAQRAIAPETKTVLRTRTTELIEATIKTAYFLVDGLADGLWMEDEMLAFNILQATGERISKTEYIACPSCGRTLFNIQQVLQKIKKETTQFKGLKIGVMGCIVNGPGEMADADYGYVGAGPGKVHLYKGQTRIKKNIDEQDAIQELLNLINLK